MNQTIQFFDYHLWANTLVFNHLKELPSEVTYKDVQSVFPSLYDTLSHMYRTDFVWLKTMKGESFDKTLEAVQQLNNENLGRSTEVLEKDYLQVSEEYKTFIQQLDDVNDRITINHPSYGSWSVSYAELLQHVANHGTYHRGNITAILRQLGYKGTPTDYVYYLFELKSRQS
ncbi:putative damage-inducible protein DinB [Bacillus pakistanensis]|uniref:Damage-inducible protein DinB n=1 Tax=Rossellomorea pakistanensis TaxID=992288 RepID=A0ABS2NEY3_9BACI|nr:DinB family protein [Bacillus pakistanensis]MBM7586416.1 putative damage-inducible protein DinB [Bacillus pakistanensis]